MATVIGTSGPYKYDCSVTSDLRLQSPGGEARDVATVCKKHDKLHKIRMHVYIPIPKSLTIIRKHASRH